MSKIKQLKNADIHKVDLVPAGAQQLSKITIMKGGPNMNDKVAKLSDDELLEVQGLLDELKAKLGITDEEECEKEEDTKDDNVKSEGSDNCNVPNGEGNNCEKEDDIKDDNVKSEDTKVTEDTGCEKGNCEKEEGTKDDNVKSEEDPKVTEALKKAADVEAENTKLKENIAKMEDEKEQKEFIAKASVLKNIPGVNENELVTILRTIYKSVDKDTFNKVESLLKSANDTIGSSSLFVENGSSASSSGEPTTADEAWKMIEKLAESRVAKGISSTANCIADVLDTPEGANLYMKYKALRGGN